MMGFVASSLVIQPPAYEACRHLPVSYQRVSYSDFRAQTNGTGSASGGADPRHDMNSPSVPAKYPPDMWLPPHWRREPPRPKYLFGFCGTMRSGGYGHRRAQKHKQL